MFMLQFVFLFFLFFFFFSSLIVLFLLVFSFILSNKARQGFREFVRRLTQYKWKK